MKKTIVLGVDGLHHGYLGCYGNAWIHTPVCDRLASESWVADTFWLDGATWEDVLASLWTGVEARRRVANRELTDSLPGRLSAAGVGTTLLTDVPAIEVHRWSGAFDELVIVDRTEAGQTAATIEQTQMARLFAAASDWLREASANSYLLWVQCQAMAGAWDAPLEFRQRFVDGPEEEAPPSGVRFAAKRLPPDFDPDELLGWRRAYAGQVELFDACLGGLLESIEQHALDETLLIVVSTCGYPLGEHGRFGYVDRALHGELVHVPLMMRVPGNQAGGGSRSGSLVQPGDVCATLLDWHGLGSSQAAEGWHRSLLALAKDETLAWRDVAVVKGSDSEWGIHAPAWYLRVEGETGELFRKPDDRWEVNDVSGRCREVVVELRELLANGLQPGDPSWPSLSDSLLEGLE